jgi:hypothetical protein
MCRVERSILTDPLRWAPMRLNQTRHEGCNARGDRFPSGCLGYDLSEMDRARIKATLRNQSLHFGDLAAVLEPLIRRDGTQREVAQFLSHQEQTRRARDAYKPPAPEVFVPLAAWPAALRPPAPPATPATASKLTLQPDHSVSGRSTADSTATRDKAFGEQCAAGRPTNLP